VVDSEVSGGVVLRRAPEVDQDASLPAFRVMNDA
jgi:hypothetical protein